MPAWPTFQSTPLRSTGPHRPPSRSDARAMMALRRWHMRTRDGRPDDRGTRAVEAALRGLAERERQAVELWLGGAEDRRIDELVGLPPPALGVLRMQLLADVSQRLQARPPARRRGSVDGWTQDDDGGAR